MSEIFESSALLYLLDLVVSQFLLQLYKEHQSQIRTTLHWLPDKVQTYYNLEWRLDVQVCNSYFFKRRIKLICGLLRILTLKYYISEVGLVTIWEELDQSLQSLMHFIVKGL